MRRLNNLQYRNGHSKTDNMLSKIAMAMVVSTEYLKTGKSADLVNEEMIQYMNRDETLRRVIRTIMQEDGL